MRSQDDFLIYRHSYPDRYIGLRDVLSPYGSRNSDQNGNLEDFYYHHQGSNVVLDAHPLTPSQQHPWSARTGPTAETCTPRCRR